MTPSRLCLPLSFDVDALRDALARVPDDVWIDHFNTGDYDGHWSVTALRGPADAKHPIQQVVAHPGITAWGDTALLESLPAFGAALDRFACPLQAVRLMRLGAGAVIHEHTDPGMALDDGEVRVHVPIQTHEDVVFTHDGDRVHLSAGHAWYLDVSRPHAVANRSDADRVHLVVDCVVNDWLRDVFARGHAPSDGNAV